MPGSYLALENMPVDRHFVYFSMISILVFWKKSFANGWYVPGQFIFSTLSRSGIADLIIISILIGDFR